jgi:4-hydroxybenzoate polyprenyltransferase
MLRYLLVLSRPRFWLYLAGPVLVGVSYAAGAVPELFSPAALVLFAYFLVPANVYLYGVNDVFDRDVDEANPKKEGREARYRGGRAVAAVVAVCGLLLLPVAAVLPEQAWPWLAGWLVLATEYSAPPLRFKTTPFLDSLSNGLYVLPGAAAYAALAGAHPPLLAVAGGWLWAMGMHTFSAIPDIEPDREAGIATTATYLGKDSVFAYCASTWLLSAAVFSLVDFRFGVVLLAYPVLVFGIRRLQVDIDRAYWWYPAVNTLVGMLFTLGGLWGVVYG